MEIMYFQAGKHERSKGWPSPGFPSWNNKGWALSRRRGDGVVCRGCPLWPAAQFTLIG